MSPVYACVHIFDEGFVKSHLCELHSCRLRDVMQAA